MTTNALWPELYGAAHLGAIRAVVTAAVVLSTALAPGLVGILLDAGLALSTQLHAMVIYCLAAAAAMAVLLPRLSFCRGWTRWRGGTWTVDGNVIS